MTALSAAHRDGRLQGVLEQLAWRPGEAEPDPVGFAMSIDSILRFAAARAPQDPCVIWRRNVINFERFDQMVDTVTLSLIERFGSEGSLQGARIGVHAKKEPANITAMVAVLRAGGILVPLNPALKAAQLSYIAKNCSMTVAIAPQKTVVEVTAIAPDQSCSWSAIDGPVVGTTDALLSRSKEALAPFECPSVPDETAILFYTSGSTGQPKGVMVSHHANVLGAGAVAHYLGLSAQDRVLTLLPLSFDYGFNQLVSTWFAGGAAVLHDFFLPGDVPKVVARHGVTGIAAVPPLWHMVLEAPWADGAADTVRYVTNSGGKLSRDLQERMRARFGDAEIFAMYGLTEAFRSTYMPPHGLAAKPDAMGQAIPFAKIAVATPDGALAGEGEPGELVHAGPLVAKGYWNDPERTARRFKPVPEGLREALEADEYAVCVFSGDQAMRDADGDFHFIGRMDDMIKVLGNRLSPQEIEDVVMAVDGVGTVAAFGLEDPVLGARVAIAVERGETGANDTQLLQAIDQACKASLAGFAQPKHIFLRRKLPRNPNGKIDRPALKDAVQEWAAQEQLA